MKPYLKLSATLIHQNQIIQNLMTAHKNLSESKNVDVRAIIKLTIFILKFLKDIKHDFIQPYLESNHQGGEEPIE